MRSGYDADMASISILWYPGELREASEKLHSLERRAMNYQAARATMLPETAHAEHFAIRAKFQEITGEFEFNRISPDSSLRQFRTLLLAAEDEANPRAMRVVANLLSELARSLEYCHATAAESANRLFNGLDD